MNCVTNDIFYSTKSLMQPSRGILNSPYSFCGDESLPSCFGKQVNWLRILTQQFSQKGEQRWRLEEGEFMMPNDGCIKVLSKAVWRPSEKERRRRRRRRKRKEKKKTNKQKTKNKQKKKHTLSTKRYLFDNSYDFQVLIVIKFKNG